LLDLKIKLAKEVRMRFSKIVVLLTAISSGLPAIAEMTTMEKVAKMHCLGNNGIYKNEVTCKELCANPKFTSETKDDAVCKSSGPSAAQIALEKAEALKQAQIAADKAAKIAADKADAKKKAEGDKVVIKKTELQNGGTTTVKVDGATLKTSKEYDGPARSLNEKQSQDLFNKYCDWSGDLNEMPAADYTNKKVQRAAEILTQVSDMDFYFYGGIKRFYAATAKAGPQQYSENARLYLTQLCGEFRDRPEMIADKVKWISRMVRPGAEAQQSINYQKLIQNDESIWTQLSGHNYNNYLRFSDRLFSVRAAEAAANKTMNKILDKKLGVDAEVPVKPNTICETKFQIGEYVVKGRSVTNSSQLSAYEKEYNNFRDNTANCTQDDKDYLYNFRGDANFKHYSPESNAMIWHALSIARFCKSPTQATGVDKDITDDDCKDYFAAPFLSRYNAARSGLAAWLVYDKKYESTFQNQQLATMVLPKFDKNIGKLPFSMQVSSGEIVNTHVQLNDSTLSFNNIFLKEGNLDLKGAFERLKAAVNRHTNWYQSGYLNIAEDAPADKPDSKTQAYSPFVASSYEMSKSNTFAECGYTIQCPNPEGRKAWMFVFKVRKENWYNTYSLAQKYPLNFDKYWLDETSFGTDSLADAERAFDRLGTAIEGEFAEIIYLKNLSAGNNSDNGTPVDSTPIK
jgi:hypothetical protein